MGIVLAKRKGMNMTIVSHINGENKQRTQSRAAVAGETAPYNITFGILSAFAILMVAAGHAGYDILTVGGLFPYYSFHVPLFMFISGYFYRREEEERPFLYCVVAADFRRIFHGGSDFTEKSVSGSLSSRVSVYL